ncbi:MAG: hypothetical protein V4526_02000 [Patescibacteria group bacterium]
MARPCEVAAFKLSKGHASLITSLGFVAVADGGGTAEILRNVGSELSVFDRTIDLMILTAIEPNRIVGLIELMNKYPVYTLLLPSWSKATSTKELKELQETAFENGVPVLYAQAPADFHFAHGLSIKLLAPTRTYEPSKKELMSQVFSLECNESSVLFLSKSTKRLQKFVVETLNDKKYKTIIHHTTGAASLFYDGIITVFNPDTIVYSKKIVKKSIAMPEASEIDTSIAGIKFLNIAEKMVRLIP